MMRLNHALEACIVLVAYGYIYLAPFTKVEESFSLHFVHDMLSSFSGKNLTAIISLDKFDHVAFPGAVPRSFLGPLVLSVATWPFLWLGSQCNLWHNTHSVQILVRLVLASLSSASLIFFFRRVRDSFGRPVAALSMLFTLSQFHLLFYLGRTLPNMIAFPLVQVVLAMFIAPWAPRTKKGKGSNVELLEGFAVLTFTAIVMRLELLALLIPLALECWSKKMTTVSETILVGAAAAVVALGTTIGLDSFLWNRLVWPEGEAIFFNVVKGHASDWGVSPWHFYFSNSLPRLFNFSLPFIFLVLFIDRRARSLAFPSFAFIALLSCLGHKEWRFFVYVIPLINVCAAAGVQSLELLFSRSWKHIATALIVLTNLSFASMALFASMHNYPGGEAMLQLSRTIGSSLHSDGPIDVHIDSHSAMTGASRFQHYWEFPDPWYIHDPLRPLEGSSISPHLRYNRSESLSLLPNSTDFDSFAYLITQSPLSHRGFDVIATFKEFGRYKVSFPRSENRFWPIAVEWRESVWIMGSKKPKNRVI